MEPQILDFESIYFDLYELDSGIFAAISAEKLPTSNAGFFDLGNFLVIFDTLMDPFSTIDLIKASKQYTNKDPTFLINSHHHLDHLFGNRKFPMNIPIISSNEVLEETKSYLPARLKDFRDMALEEIKKAKEALINEKNPDKILELKNDINTYNELLQPDFSLRPPDFIVNDSFTIKGTKNQVQLKYVGAAHSVGDIVAIFEKEKICFMGDLVFEKTDPSWADPNSGIARPANLENFRTILLEYAEKDIDLYVPGHGNFCTKQHLSDNADFYNEYYIKKNLTT